MESKVLRESSVLEVEFTVKVKCNGCGSKTIESSQINFDDYITLSAKQVSHISNHYDDDYEEIKRHNIVLINIQKMNKSDKSTYRMILSCPEFKIHQSIFYSDDTQWRVLNENTHTDTYKFIITLQVETLTDIKFSVLYEDEELTDFKLIGKDGEIDIHKAFLAAISACFKSKLVNKDVKSLDIPNASLKTLKHFKKSIYMEYLPDENLKELLLLASYFKINWLECKCVDKIKKNMSSADAIDLLEFALKHSSVPLILGVMENVISGDIKLGEIRKHYLQKSVHRC